MIFKFLKKSVKSIFSGAKKLMKKVAPALKKLAPIIAIGAVAYFTMGGGAALLAGKGAGAAAAGAAKPGFIASLVSGFKAGGWGGAAQAFSGGLGLGGSLGGTILTGAIKYAGYGAVAGGATAALTGKNVWKGVKAGALGGALLGGAVGAVAGPAAPVVAGGASGAPSVAAETARSIGAKGFGGAAAPTAAGGAAAAGGGGGGVGGFLRNITPAQAALIGPTLSGAGKGVFSYLQGKQADKAHEQEIKRRQGSYAGTGEAATVDYGNLGTIDPASAPSGSGEAARSAQRGGSYVRDPYSGSFRFTESA